MSGSVIYLIAELRMDDERLVLVLVLMLIVRLVQKLKEIVDIW